MVKRGRAALWGLLALAFAAGQAAASCVLGRFAEIPVTMSDLRPLVTLKINGAPAQFVVDSGASVSTIDSAAATQFRLPLKPFKDFMLTGAGGDTDVWQADVNTLTIGNANLHHITLLVPKSEMGDETAGYLGQDVLSDADVEYDLANGVIRLMKPAGCGRRPLAYWLAPKQPYGLVELEPISVTSTFAIGQAVVNGVKIRVLFDTGAGASVLTLSAARRIGIPMADMTPVGDSGGVGGHMVRDWVAPVASFEIGGETIERTRLRVADMSGIGADMLLGADFFLSHRVYVANGQERLYFTYNGGAVFKLDAPPTAVPAAPASAAPAAAASKPPPSDPTVYARRGAALASRQQYVAALADLNQAVALAPKTPEFLVQRGAILMALDKQPRALADFDAAVTLAPDDAAALMARAEIRLGGHQSAKAVPDLQAADKILPKQADERLDLAWLYFEADNPQAALNQYDLWFGAHHGDAREAAARGERCWVRAMMGSELKKALSDCNAALKARPHDLSLLDSRAMVRLRMGDLDAAISEYDLVLVQTPKSGWSLYGRGLAELKTGQAAKGKADIAAGLAVNPDIAKEAVKARLTP